VRPVGQVGGELLAEAGQPHAAPLVDLRRPHTSFLGDIGGGLDHLAAPAQQIQAFDPQSGQLADPQAV
jgi:hypothetical protein